MRWKQKLLVLLPIAGVVLGMLLENELLFVSATIVMAISLFVGMCYESSIRGDTSQNAQKIQWIAQMQSHPMREWADPDGCLKLPEADVLGELAYARRYCRRSVHREVLGEIQCEGKAGYAMLLLDADGACLEIVLEEGSLSLPLPEKLVCDGKISKGQIARYLQEEGYAVPQMLETEVWLETVLKCDA